MSQTFRQKYFGSRLFYKEVAAIAIPVMAQISYGSRALWRGYGLCRNDDDFPDSDCVRKSE